MTPNRQPTNEATTQHIVDSAAELGDSNPSANHVERATTFNSTTVRRHGNAKPKVAHSDCRTIAECSAVTATE